MHKKGSDSEAFKKRFNDLDPTEILKTPASELINVLKKS
jgi:hypothetical protein